MKFPKLPLRCKTNILHQMVPSDVFFLSLASKASTKLILSVNWSEVAEISFQAKCEPDAFIYISMIDRRRWRRDLLTLLPVSRGFANMRRITLMGIDACWLPHVNLQGYSLSHHLFIYHDEQTKHALINAVSHRITALFGKNARLGMRTNGSRCIPVNLGFKYSRLFETTEKYIDDYLRVFPVQSYLFIQNFSLTLEFYPPPEFYQTEELVVKCKEIKTDILNNFRGRFLFMVGTAYSDTDIITFLKGWRHRAVYDKLQRVSLTTLRPMDVNKVINETGIQVFPSGLTPQPAIWIDGRSYICQLYVVRDNRAVGFLIIVQHRIVFHATRISADKLWQRFRRPDPIGVD